MSFPTFTRHRPSEPYTCDQCGLPVGDTWQEKSAHDGWHTYPEHARAERRAAIEKEQGR